MQQRLQDDATTTAAATTATAAATATAADRPPHHGTPRRRDRTTATNLNVSLSRIVSTGVGLATGAGGGGEGNSMSCCASMACCSLNSASFGVLGLPWSMRAQRLCGGWRERRYAAVGLSSTTGKQGYAMRFASRWDKTKGYRCRELVSSKPASKAAQ